MKNDWKKWIPELLLAALAVALRAPGLGRAVLTETESRMLFLAGEPLDRVLYFFDIGAEKYFGSSLPYVIFIKYWTSISDSELWFRLPAFTAGALTIALAYMLARKMFGRWAGRAAALMLAVSPYHIMLCRSGTETAAALFFLAVAVYVLWLIYRDEAGRAAVAVFILSTVILAGFHYYILLLILPANIIVIGFGRNTKKHLWWWIPLNVIVVGICVFWWGRWIGGPLLPSQTATLTGEFATEMKVFPGDDILNLRFRFLFIEKYLGIVMKLGGFYAAGELLNGWSVLALVFVLFMYHFLPFSGFREYEEGYRPRLFAFFMLAAFVAAGAALSFTAQPPRAGLMPAAIIFYAICANGLIRVATWRTRSFFILTILAVLFGCVPSVRISENKRPDWPRAAEVINEKSNIDAPVVLIDGWDFIPFSIYAPGLEGRATSLFPNFDLEILEPGRMKQDAILPPLNGMVDNFPPYALRDIAATSSFIWVIRNDSKDKKPGSKHEHEYKIWLDEKPVAIQSHQLGGGYNLVLYSTANLAPGAR